jgi:hypothetical protein
MTPEEARTANIHIRVRPSLKERMETYAHAKGMNLTEMIETVFSTIMDWEHRQKNGEA